MVADLLAHLRKAAAAASSAEKIDSNSSSSSSSSSDPPAHASTTSASDPQPQPSGTATPLPTVTLLEHAIQAFPRMEDAVAADLLQCMADLGVMPDKAEDKLLMYRLGQSSIYCRTAEQAAGLLDATSKLCLGVGDSTFYHSIGVCEKAISSASPGLPLTSPDWLSGLVLAVAWHIGRRDKSYWGRLGQLGPAIMDRFSEASARDFELGDHSKLAAAAAVLQQAFPTAHAQATRPVIYTCLRALVWGEKWEAAAAMLSSAAERGLQLLNASPEISGPVLSALAKPEVSNHVPASCHIQLLSSAVDGGSLTSYQRGALIQLLQPKMATVSFNPACLADTVKILVRVKHCPEPAWWQAYAQQLQAQAAIMTAGELSAVAAALSSFSAAGLLPSSLCGSAASAAVAAAILKLLPSATWGQIADMLEGALALDACRAPGFTAAARAVLHARSDPANSERDRGVEGSVPLDAYVRAVRALSVGAHQEVVAELGLGAAYA